MINPVASKGVDRKDKPVPASALSELVNIKPQDLLYLNYVSLATLIDLIKDSRCMPEFVSL